MSHTMCSVEAAPKFRKVPASTLHISRPIGWLTSRFHFSFADYYNPANTNFGVLRVLNDDLVTAQNGFPTHPHRDQEIFSYIVDGELSHRDSKGNAETLGRGCVQYMSAGTGVTHSEMNNHLKDTCRFLQIWITPMERRLPVRYGSYTFTEADRANKLLHMIKGTGDSSGADAPIQLMQDVNVYVSEIDVGNSVFYDLGSGRQAYMVQIEGESILNGEMSLEMRDGLEIVGPGRVEVVAKTDRSHIILIEMALVM